jgi:hypothetical protein
MIPMQVRMDAGITGVPAPRDAGAVSPRIDGGIAAPAPDAGAAPAPAPAPGPARDGGVAPIAPRR